MRLLILFLLPLLVRAAFERDAGIIALNTSTGAQTVSGLSFPPKVIILRWNELTAPGASAGAPDGYEMGIGAATATSQFAIYGRQTDGSLNADGRHTSDKCLTRIDSNGVVREAATCALASDGFTLTITTATSAIIVQWMALGGSDLTNVAIKQFDSPTATGTAGVTGVGFQPTAAMFFTAGSTAAIPSSFAYSRISVGIAASASSQAGMGNCVLSASNADTGAQSTSKALYVPDTSAMYLVGAVDSFDADGFTIDWTTVQASPVHMWAILFEGLRAEVGALNQPTSTGTQSYVSFTHTPEVMIFGSYCLAAATGQQAHARMSLGGSLSAALEGAYWAGAVSGNNIADAAVAVDGSVLCYTAGTPTLNAKAELVQLTSIGFDLNWLSADATQRQVIFISLAGTSGAGTVNPLIISRAGMIISRRMK